MAAPTGGAVAAAFSRRGFAPADDGVAEKLAALAGGDGSGADGLARKFEAYAMATGIAPSEVTPALVAAFEREAAVAAASAVRRPSAVGLSWDDAADALADNTNLLLPRGGGGRPSAVAKTPAPRRPGGGAAAAALTPLAPTPGSAFAARTRAGETVATLRPDIVLPDVGEGAAEDMVTDAAATTDAALAPRAAVRHAAPGRPPSARLLTDSLAARAAYVDGRVAAFEAALAAAGAAPPTGAVGTAAQDAAVFVGRVVVADGDGAGRPTPGVAAVEGCVARSGGGRAKLDLSRAAAPWRLFPGQTVAVAGTCPSGHTLVADALVASAPAPAARSRRAALAAAAAATGAAGLRVVVAAGPFATGEDGGGAYEGLDAVLAAAGAGAARPADAVVLVGPFVDADAPAVAALDRTFDDVFEVEVVARLAAFAAAARAAGRAPPPVVLVPSPRDATAAPTFPTPALPLPPSTPPNVVALPNPATFSLNDGLVIGVTGHDVLRDLSRAEAAGGAPAGAPPRDRLASLASALLEQASFYPLYPPAPGSFFDAGAAGANGGAGVGMAASPDVLLLPSDLAPFARVAAAPPPPPAGAVEGDPPPPGGVVAVAVNPGRAVRGGGGAGTLAVLQVAPLALAPGGDDDATAPHGVVDRCRVDVVRV